MICRPIVVPLVCLLSTAAFAQEAAPTAPAKLVSLNPEATLLLDAANKTLIVKSTVVLREGTLEMLLCKKQTKEHESILAVDAKAYLLHAGLVALGLDPGKPVRFSPEYVAPTGPKLTITAVWTAADGKSQRQDVRHWIRHATHRYFIATMPSLPPGVTIPASSELRFDKVNQELSWYGPMTAEQRDDLLKLSDDATFQTAIRTFFASGQSKVMQADWVFAGSGFVNVEGSGEAYLAESGDVICVANFPSATIDVAMRSASQGNENLLFEAWTERIPPQGTAVQLEIQAVREIKPATTNTEPQSPAPEAK